MPTSSLSVWKTFVQGVGALFSLDRRAWVILGIPLLVLVASATMLLLLGLDGGQQPGVPPRGPPGTVREPATQPPEATNLARQHTGERYFWTVDKAQLQLRYVLRWQVADVGLFARTLAGDSVRAEQRIDDFVVSLLRARVARLSPADLHREGPILDTAVGSIGREDVRQAKTDSELLQALNRRTQDFGIAVDRLRLERLEGRVDPN